MNSCRKFALIPAAGVGSRMGSTLPKQYLPLLGKTVLEHTLAAFLQCPQIEQTVLVLSPEDNYFQQLLPLAPPNLRVLYCGGASRAESVFKGLQQLQHEWTADDWVLVHDAARPGLQSSMITGLIEACGEHEVGAMLALPVVDSVKRATPQQFCSVPRDDLWLAQTPQMFRYGLLLRALQAGAGNPAITDEASAVEALHLRPLLHPGHPCNLKVTLPADLEIAQMYLQAAHHSLKENSHE